jgi:hypothetical protein
MEQWRRKMDKKDMVKTALYSAVTGPTQRMLHRLKTLRRDETGSMAVEGVLSVLLLAGWLVISVQLVDGYRVKTLNTKAAYTISDLLSREKTTVGPAYVDQMKKVFDFVTDARGDSWIRVTLVEWSDKNNRFEVLHSAATGSRQAYTTAALQSEAGRIPAMPVGDMAVIVETSMNFDPLFGIGDTSLTMGGETTRIGLGSGIWMSNFVVTRPRNSTIKWNDAY